MRSRVPLSALHVRDDEPPMHLPAVLALLDGSRVDERPLEVAVDEDGRLEIQNGRHRFVAALLRGDRDIEVDDERS